MPENKETVVEERFSAWVLEHIEDIQEALTAITSEADRWLPDPSAEKPQIVGDFALQLHKVKRSVNDLRRITKKL